MGNYIDPYFLICVHETIMQAHSNGSEQSNSDNEPDLIDVTKLINKKINAKPNDSNDFCVICLDEFTPTAIYQINCGHCFHDKCIERWLRLKQVCPICRVECKTTQVNKLI